MAVPYKLNYFEIESGLGTTSTFLHKGDLTANRIIKIDGTSNDILLGDGSTGSLSGKQNTITLTTSGTSGAATLIGATLNIPQYTDQFVGTVTSVGLTSSTSGVTISSSPITTSGNIVLSIATASGSQNGLLSSADWTTFNNKTSNLGTVTSVAALTLGTTGTDLNSTVANGTTTPVITLNVPTASATNRGALSSTDWSTFNAKQPAGNYITSLTGEATASGPGAASVTLDNTAVIGKVLTGLNITGGTVASTDSILTALGKVQNQINGLIGGSIFQGTWDANTNTPALTSSVGTNGHYYIVSVAGTTNLNGITDWEIGDWAIFAGTTWQKVDNTDAVIAVNGYTGNVSLVTGDVLEGAGTLPGRPSQLYFTDARARAAISLTTSGTSGAATYDNGTGVLNIPQYQAVLTNPITGSLTTNYLPKATGANSLGNSILNEVGNAINLTNAGNSFASFGIINPGTPGDPGVDNDAYIGSTINNDFTIRVNNTEAARFDTSLRLKIANIQNATTDTDKFLVSDGGVVKYRTGAELLSDIGGASAGDLSGYVPYTGATANVDLGIYNITPSMVYISGAGTGGGGVLNLKKDTTRTVGGADAANTISVWADGATLGFNDWVSGNVRSAKFSVASITNNATRTYTLPNSDGTIALISDIPSLTNYVTLDTAQTITGAKTLTDLLTGTRGSFASSGNDDTFAINHSSGSGIGLSITKGGNGEGLYVNKTSGTGNAATIIGTLNATALVKSGGTSSQFLMADGSVNTNVLASGAYLPLSGGTLTGALGGTSATFSGSVIVGTTALLNFGPTTNFVGLSGNNSTGTLSFYANSMSERMQINPSGNLGLGVTPSAWVSSKKAYQTVTSSFVGDSGRLELWFNGYFDGDNEKYIGNGFSTLYTQLSGNHVWSTAPNNTSGAGANISFTQAMTLSANGNLLINTTSDTGLYKLDVNGTGRFSEQLRVSNTTGSALDMIVLETGFNNPSGNKSIIWKDATNTVGRISVDYDAPLGSMRFGSLYNNAYTTSDILVLSGTGAATFSSTAQNAFLINSTNTDGPILQIQNSGNNLGLIGNAEGITNGGATNFAIRATNNLIFSTGGANPRMTITSGGRVLIGSPPPTESTFQLDVNGTGRFSGALKTGNPTGGTAQPFKVGSVYSTSSVFDGNVLQVEINGVSYDLMIADSAT